jgi:UDP-arabinose 4-epimerase
MTTILVTGGAGYIGSHTCRAVAASGYTPVVYDNLCRGHADFVRWGPLVVGDVLDRAALDRTFAQYRPAAVIHFAALAYVGESVSDPLSYYKTNTAGMVNVLEAMTAAATDKIVFSSSCAIYGIPDSVPIAESAAQRPISPYGRSKLMCEQMIKDTAAAGNLRFVILRYFNAAGAEPSGDLPERHEPETHLIPLALDAAMGKAPPLHVFGTDYATRDGTCERDFIHVSDLAAAHVAAISRIDDDMAREFNLGAGQAHSVLEVVSCVERIVGKPVPLVHAARRPGDPPSLFADPASAQRHLGFQPKHSRLETIVETAWRSRRVGQRPPR